MYRINLCGRPVLLTPDEFLFHAASDDTVDTRQVSQNIIIAEERWIAPTLCDGFYEDFCRQKNRLVDGTNQATLLADINASLTAQGKPTIVLADIPVGTWINAIEFVTDTNYVELWNWYLWKLCTEAVDLTTIVPSWLRHTPQGQQKNNPAVIGGNGKGSETGDRKDVQFKIDKFVQDRIDPLIARMELWICKRKSLFPLYTKSCESNNPNGLSWKRKTDFVFLNDDEECGCSTPCSSDTNCIDGIINEDIGCIADEDGNVIGIE